MGLSPLPVGSMLSLSIVSELSEIYKMSLRTGKLLDDVGKHFSVTLSRSSTFVFIDVSIKQGLLL